MLSPSKKLLKEQLLGPCAFHKWALYVLIQPQKKHKLSDGHTRCTVTYYQDPDSSTQLREWQLLLTPWKTCIKSSVGNLRAEVREAASSPGAEAQEWKPLNTSNTAPLWGQRSAVSPEIKRLRMACIHTHTSGGCGKWWTNSDPKNMISYSVSQRAALTRLTNHAARLKPISNFSILKTISILPYHSFQILQVLFHVY